MSVSEVSKSSSLLSKSNTSSSQASESEGFIDVLKSAFHSKSDNSEAVSASEDVTAVDEAEVEAEGAKVTSSDAEGELAVSEEGEEAISGSKTADVDGEESTDSLLKQEASQKTDSLDQTMNEGNQLLERLDKSNKALATEGKALPPEVAAVTATTAATATSQTSAELAQKSIGAQERVNAQGLPQGIVEDIEIDAAIVAGGAAVGSLAALEAQPMDGKGVPSVTSSDDSLATESADQVQISPETAAIGTGAAASIAAVTSTSDETQAANGGEQIQWSSPQQANNVDAETQAAMTFQDNTQVVDQAQVIPVAAAGVTGVTASQQLQATAPDGQPLAAQDDIASGEQYAEPMWATANVDPSLEGSKKTLDGATSAKVAASAALAAQLHNPTSAPLPADKAAAAMASSAAVAQEATIQTAQTQALAAAANAPSAPLVAAEQAKIVGGAAAAAAVFGDGKGHKSANGQDEKGDLSHQLAGVAGQQGLGATQARGLEAQAASGTQQPPLQLTRDGASDQLAERVQMMMSKNLKNIDIRLDPPELGRMQIRMTMNNDVASIQFTVANQQTRDIVEQAMPRLREMLAQQGLQLADTSVQQQNAGQQQQSQYVANQNGQQGRRGGDFDAESEQELDNSVEVNVDVTSNRDGISFYA